MPIIANDYAYVCFRLCLPFPTKDACFFRNRHTHSIFASSLPIYIFYRIFVRKYQ